MLKLTIGKLNIQLEGIDAGEIPENTLLFRSEFEEADMTYTFRIGENPPSFRYSVIYQAKDIVVFGKPDGREVRLLYMPDSHSCYGYYEELGEKEIIVYVNKSFRRYLKLDTIFVSLLALERHEARRGAFVLHCAYMDFGNEAILFSGPSGIGKTTHTNLWCQYLPGQAQVLNGDKCLLSREGNAFYASGWPICGSSGICHNERRQVHAVVLLQQAPDNRLIEEKKVITFRRVLEQLTVNYWNRAFTDAAMSFTDSLVSTLPCFTYACNISREAVDVLYKQLKTDKDEKK